MSTYTRIMYQLVFSTKHREKTLEKSGRDKLFRYISGILKNKKCHLYTINGVEDHLHILTHIHPVVSLSSLMKDIKLASTEYIKEDRIFPHFNGWQDGYGAFTYAYGEKDRLINYIQRQEVHHSKIPFKEEYIEILQEHGLEFDEKYFL